MSTWQPESELSRFNRAATTEPFPVSPATATVFQHALAVSEITGGAFDVTVGPLVDAWGFGPPGRPPAAPADADLARIRMQVGWQQLAVDVAASTIRKRAPAVSADLSALAKGYAVDQVAELLEREGFTNYLVEVGGEVRAAGRSTLGNAWRVGIERPSAGPPAVYRTIPLDGYALATALMVLGPDDGYALAVEEDWPALFLLRLPDGDLEERATPAWAPFTVG